MADRSSILLVGLLMAVLAAVGVSKAEEGTPHGEEEAGAQHEFHRNHLSFFLGITEGGEAEGHGEEDAAGTLGLDYERRLTRLVGVGILLDYAGGDRRTGIVGVPVTFHAGRAAKFLVAPGIERNSETDHSEFLLRLGFAYDFEVSRATIAPVLNLDLVDGEQVYVVGINVGWGF